jgi:hypothetical protein
MATSYIKKGNCQFDAYLEKKLTLIKGEDINQKIREVKKEENELYNYARSKQEVKHYKTVVSELHEK